MSPTAEFNPAEAGAWRPAYLGDAADGARIRFDLPATGGGVDTFTGTVTGYERGHHAVGAATVRFTLDTTGRRVFTCRPDLHIGIQPTATARKEPRS